MCSVTVVFIHTMEDDQRLNTLVHEGDTLHLPTIYHRQLLLHMNSIIIIPVLCSYDEILGIYPVSREHLPPAGDDGG